MSGFEHVLVQSAAVVPASPRDGVVQSAPESSPSGVAVLDEGVLGAGCRAREFSAERREYEATRFLDEIYDEIEETR